MSYIISILLILGGFALLVKGGDWLVDGSVSIARKARLSTMVIGLTVIGFGTSAPELFVSAQAALAGSPGISIGNVVGSNIANIALILGATAIIVPCVSKPFTLRVEVPMMILACLLMVAVGMSGTIGRLAGICGVLILVSFVAWEVIRSRRISKKQDSIEENSPAPMALWKAILLVLLAFAMLVVGANILIEGATQIAKGLGVSERVIGLTIVAVGTSLPELFASIMAARKGQDDMAVGNIIGSVTFNIFCGIGVSAAICPIEGSDQGFLSDYIIMGSLALILWLFMFTKRTLERWEGVVLFTSYVAYIIYTVIA